jgi:hypothetical protein
MSAGRANARIHASAAPSHGAFSAYASGPNDDRITHFRAGGRS